MNTVVMAKGNIFPKHIKKHIKMVLNIKNSPATKCNNAELQSKKNDK